MRGPALPLLALASVLVTAAAAEPPRARARLMPGVARLGERVLYRAEVIASPGTRVRWVEPDSMAEVTWGPPRRGHTPGNRGRAVIGPGQRPGPDTSWIEFPIQAFRLGTTTIPGLVFEITDGDPRALHRAPTVKLAIAPTLMPADSQASLRPLRTLASPWWERVPWLWLLLGALAIAAAILIWKRLRRKQPAPAAAAAPVSKPGDPTAEALAALAALREARLLERGQFAEHAYRLGQILRRYLEATLGSPRPGDVTPELEARLRQAPIDASDQTRIASLLRVWDRIKFAREPFTVPEAQGTEATVEAFVRRSGTATSGAA